MAVNNNIREPFGWKDVESIVKQEIEAGDIDNLKTRVTDKVLENTRITGKLPDRVRTWIHQICMSHTAGTEIQLNGKVTNPIDLASLPNRAPKIL